MEQSATPAAEEIPLDSDDTLGAHFGDLIRRPLTLSLGSTAAIVAFVVGALAGGLVVGLIVAVAAVLITVLIVWLAASSAAEEDFFVAYARARSLDRVEGRSNFPPTSPLLRKGDRRYAEHVMHGTLPGGLPGALGFYIYEVTTRDSKGHSNTSRYPFTVVMHDLPAVAAKVSDVYCQRRSGFRFMDGTEDAFRRMQRLELESDALDRRYEIFFGAGDDETWLKQLFSPSFIVWLTGGTPEDFAFEFSAGSLCVNAKGRRNDAADLDAMCLAAATVAHRLSGEAAE